MGGWTSRAVLWRTTAITALRAQRLNGIWHQFWQQLPLANPPTSTSL